MVASVSGTRGRSRARSVRRVSARTNASNRSSLLPADPYRPRRFLTWFGLITTTVSPSVGSFDRDITDAVTAQCPDQVTQARAGVGHRAPVDLAAAVVDDRQRVVIAGPVHPRGQIVGRELGQCVVWGIAGRLHVSLLAARPSGEAPSSSGVVGAGTCLPVRSLIGARSRSTRPWRAALSTVHTSRATTRSCRSQSGRHSRQASRAVTWRHPGCIDALSENADPRMVHQ